MDTLHILLIDLDPEACSEGHCRRLGRLLCGISSSRPLSIQTLTHLPSETCYPPPNLIVLRPAVTDNLSKMVQFLRRRWSLAPVFGLFCTGKDMPTSVYQALHHGLDDFFCCPLRDIDVFPRVQRLLEDKEASTTHPIRDMKAQLHRAGLVGASSAFLQVIDHVLRVAPSDATILLNGETGTGKELVARVVHDCSPRQDKPFVSVNCGALPDHLVENELFGHAKGAYTDASSSEKGLVTEAEGGTLFLDEVDTLSASAQVKLLRFLQNREYRLLGSAKSHTADVRFIAATNVDLQQQVHAQRFREDLYYRLNILALRLPPLRERSEDIPLLAHHFLHRYGRHYGHESLRLSAATVHKLVAYPWPGNVRELETVMQRAVILASSLVLQPEDIELPGSCEGVVSSANDSFHAAKAQVIEQFERTYLTNLLAAHKGNITHAAKHAGQARRSLQRLLKKYNLNHDAS